MTFAAVPALRTEPALAAEWEPAGADTAAIVARHRPPA
jgi:hypothetical protein